MVECRRAPEGRQKVAHGASRGNRTQDGISPVGAEERRLFRPLRGYSRRHANSHGLRRGLISIAPSGLLEARAHA
jgi:hypothetical protein